MLPGSGKGLCAVRERSLCQTQRQFQRGLCGAPADPCTVRAGDEQIFHIHLVSPGSAQLPRAHRPDGIAAAGVICDENIAPVVMLTAFSQPDLVRQATGAGAMAYVTKPYEESKLLPALEVAMGRFSEINDLLDNVETSENKLKETEEQLKKAEEKLKKAEDTLEERKLVDRAKGLLMDKADFSEQGAFRWIQKTSMDQRIPKKRLAMAIIAKYGDPKPSEVGE